jgi:hypothetical protein
MDYSMIKWQATSMRTYVPVGEVKQEIAVDGAAEVLALAGATVHGGTRHRPPSHGCVPSPAEVDAPPQQGLVDGPPPQRAHLVRAAEDIICLREPAEDEIYTARPGANPPSPSSGDGGGDVDDGDVHDGNTKACSGWLGFLLIVPNLRCVRWCAIRINHVRRELRFFF